MKILHLKPTTHPHCHHHCCGASKQGTAINAKQRRWIASHPADDENTQAGSKAVSAGILYTSEASLSNKDGANDIGNSRNDSLAHCCATMTSEAIM
jgi:hypothetical protein